jgi:hypothetical protein
MIVRKGMERTWGMATLRNSVGRMKGRKMVRGRKKRKIWKKTKE